MTHDAESSADLPQKLVNQVAEIAINRQLDSASKIEVNLDSDASQLLQGKTNSLHISGEKIVTLDDIHLEQIDIASEDLALNLTQILFGNIAFEQPGNFQLKFIFSESDCDRLLNSKYVKILLQNLQLDLDQQPACFYLQQSKCRLQQDNNLSLRSTVVIQTPEQIKTAPFTIALQLQDNGSGINFRSGQYLQNQTFSFQETVAIMNQAQDLLYLRYFQHEDLTCQITQIQIEEGQLTIKANAQIKHLPDSISQSIKSVSSEINN